MTAKILAVWKPGEAKTVKFSSNAEYKKLERFAKLEFLSDMLDAMEEQYHILLAKNKEKEKA